MGTQLQKVKEAMSNVKALLIALGCIVLIIPLLLAVVWLTPIVIIVIVGVCIFFFAKSHIAYNKERQDD